MEEKSDNKSKLKSGLKRMEDASYNLSRSDKFKTINVEQRKNNDTWNK